MRGVFLYTIQFGNIVPFYMLNLFLLPKTKAWCILLVAVSLNFFFQCIKKEHTHYVQFNFHRQFTYNCEQLPYHNNDLKIDYCGQLFNIFSLKFRKYIHFKLCNVSTIKPLSSYIEGRCTVTF